jgi:hypothetical protein
MDTNRQDTTRRNSTDSDRPQTEPKKHQSTDDEVILIEDLTPRENPKGGRKIVLGESPLDDDGAPPTQR